MYCILNAGLRPAQGHDRNGERLNERAAARH